ncbi:MAG: chemotaxis protein CheW [Candidatus Bruticola sp.]
MLDISDCLIFCYYTEHMKQFSQQKNDSPILTFKLAGSNFAVPLPCVMRVEQAAALLQVPNMPNHIIGLLNHHGTLIPVVDIRSIFSMATQPLHPSNQLVIIKAQKDNLAFVADQIIGLSSILSQTDMCSLIKTPLKIASAVTDTNQRIFLFLSPEELLAPFNLDEVRQLVQQNQLAINREGSPLTNKEQQQG